MSQPIQRSRFEDTHAAQPVRRKRILHYAAQIAREPALKRKREGALPSSLQIREQGGRQESFYRVQKKTLLSHANAGRNSLQKLDEAVIEKHGADFDAVRHAHCVEVAQEARLEVRVNVHEGEALAEIFIFHLLRPVRQMLARFVVLAAAANGWRHKFSNVAVQEKHLHGHLRGLASVLHGKGNVFETVVDFAFGCSLRAQPLGDRRGAIVAFEQKCRVEAMGRVI
jgi:hypothetical protein